MVLSQGNGFNAARAKLLESELVSQAEAEDKQPPRVVLSDSLDVHGAWTIAPLIPYLHHRNVTAKWYVFCTEDTAVRLSKLVKVLDKYDVDVYRVSSFLFFFLNKNFQY